MATAQAVEVLEDGTLAITLAGSDLDGDALTYAVTTPPMHGVLAGTAPNLTYTPAADYHGSDGFAFTAHDSALASAPALVSITVTPVNDAPVATAQAVEVLEDGTLAITLAGSDIDGDALSYTVTTPPAHGALAGTAPNLTYTPAANYHGSDGFAFTAHDSALASAPALVSITVTPVNDAPVAAAQTVEVIEDGTLAITLAGSDIDGDTLTYTVTTPPAHGALAGTAPILTYTPEANYHGSDSFAFTAHDSALASAPALVSITVTPVNDAPVATAQAVEVLEDGTLAITLAGSDIDGDALTYTVTTPPMHGALAGTAPNLTYTPAADYHGSDGFAFTAHDSALASAPALVSITVTPVNDAPVATAQTAEVLEDGTLAITLAGSDIDGDALSYTVTTPPMHGALAGTAPNLTYTPEANYHGSDGFAFTAHDSALASASALVSITVTPVNDAPVATAQAVGVIEDGTLAITLAGSDIDGDTLTYTVTTPPAHGALAGTAPNLTYTPAADYHGSDGFAFTAHDSALASAPALVSITVTPVNDAPVATAQAVGVIEDGTLAITLAGSDIDGDTLTYTVTTPPAHGVLAGTAPNLTYTPAADYHGSDGFAFTAHDSALASAPALVSITVTPVNDAPVATAQAVGVIEDGTLAITLAGSDIDGDALTYAVTTPPAHGALAGTAPNLTYTPAADYHGSDSFAFTAHDSALASPPALVSITVTPVNDAPVATAQTAEVLEDGTLAITLAGSDLDGDALTYAVTTPPMHGVLAGTAPNLTYTPAADYHGSDGFAFTAHDSALASASALVSITVTPVNDAPVATAQAVEVLEDGTLAITLAGSDIDGDALSYTVTTPPAHGALAGTAPNLTYTPAADYHGSDEFRLHGARQRAGLRAGPGFHHGHPGQRRAGGHRPGG